MPWKSGRPRPHVLPSRKALEWLASISSDHERELRRQLREEAAAAQRREYLAWLGAVSTSHETSWHAFRSEVPAHLPALIEGPDVHEAYWDPAKHPRLGGPPNAGWFATTGGSSGELSDQQRRHPAQATNFPSQKRVAAQQAALARGIGHHWNPLWCVFHESIRPRLSDEAVHYAMGAYSGQTIPDHGNKTYGDITHVEYNDLVRRQLEEYLKLRRIRKMSAAQMKEFVDLIKAGRGANGEEHGKIAAFNRAIKAQVPRGTKVPTKMEDVLAAGRKYMKSSRFRVLAAGAFVSSVLGEAIAQEAKLLDVAAKSGYYELALDALQDGDLEQAEKWLIGGSNSLQSEILFQVGATASLDFQMAVLHVFATARKKTYE